MRTKRFLITLLLCTALLAGCGTEPGAADSRGHNVGETTGAEHREIETRLDDEALAEQNRWLGGYDYQIARIGDVLYFSDWGAPNIPMLLALDLNTMEAFPLCAKPECEHKDRSCDACAGSLSAVQLTAWRGQLYFLDHALSGNVLYRADPDGSNRIEVMELSDLSKPAGGWSAAWLGIHDGIFYQCVYGQYVEDADVNGTAVLYRQPLEAGSADRAEELLRVDGAEYILAAMDGAALYCAVFVYEEETGIFLLTVYTYDMEGGGLTEFWRGSVKKAARSLTVQNGKLLFGLTTEPFALSLKDGSVTELPMSGNVTLLGDGVSMVLPRLDGLAEDAVQCRILSADGKVRYKGRYYPEQYDTVYSLAAMKAKHVLIYYAGFSGGNFYFLLNYSEYGRYVYALLVFDSEAGTYATPYVLNWEHEESDTSTVTVVDDDGTVRVYDGATGELISGPPETGESATEAAP